MYQENWKELVCLEFMEGSGGAAHQITGLCYIRKWG
jgi:hypothetical protein